MDAWEKGRGSFRKSLPGVSVESWTSLRCMVVALNSLSSLLDVLILVFISWSALRVELTSVRTQYRLPLLLRDTGWMMISPAGFLSDNSEQR